MDCLHHPFKTVSNVNTSQLRTPQFRSHHQISTTLTNKQTLPPQNVSPSRTWGFIIPQKLTSDCTAVLWSVWGKPHARLTGNNSNASMTITQNYGFWQRFPGYLCLWACIRAQTGRESIVLILGRYFAAAIPLWTTSLRCSSFSLQECHVCLPYVCAYYASLPLETRENL